MTEEGTLCINADVLKAVGEDINTTYTAEEFTNVYIKQAEGKISVASQYDWVTNYSGSSAIGKEFLRQLCAAIAGTESIKADMSGIQQLAEGQTRLNVLSDVISSGLSLLKDKDKIQFIKDGTD